MAEHLIRQTQIDPFFYEVIVDTWEQHLIDRLIDPIVDIFRALGYKTLVLTEPLPDHPGHFRVNCMAAVIQGGKTCVLSEAAAATSQGLTVAD